MDQPKINLLQPQAPLSQPNHRSRSHHPRRLLRRAGIVIFVVLVGLFISNVVIPGVRLSQSVGQASVWEQVTHLIASGNRQLNGGENDRINVLLMGIGGQGHEGPLLTDSLLLVSIQPSTGRAALISIPRDLFIPYPDGFWRKINEVYNEGEATEPGNGGAVATRTVSKVLGVDIPYFAVADFGGFKRIVDQLGGVHITIDQSFADPSYPKDDESGYKTVTFEAGGQWLNGTDALAYARSRHGTNGEGSDFARAKRQQKLLLAIKDRILSSNVLFNPITINNLVGEFGANIRTNIESWELFAFADLARHVNTEQITRTAISADPDGVLAEGTSNAGAYILSPRGGDFNLIHQMVRNVFGQRDSALEPTRVMIENGTFSPETLAKAVADAKRLGFVVVGTRAAANRPVANTTLIDYTNGGKPTSKAALRMLFQPTIMTNAMPTWLQPIANDYTGKPAAATSPLLSQTDADFVVTIGGDNLSPTLPRK